MLLATSPADRRNRLTVLGCALATAVSSGTMGCGRRQEGRELPPPPPDTKPADYQPLLPFITVAPDVLGRTLYANDADAEFVVEAREIAIPPSKTARDLKTPGAAIYQLREGAATARVGDSIRSINRGGVVAVPEGASVTFENKGEEPLFLRVHIVRAK